MVNCICLSLFAEDLDISEPAADAIRWHGGHAGAHGSRDARACSVSNRSLQQDASSSDLFFGNESKSYIGLLASKAVNFSIRAVTDPIGIRKLFVLIAAPTFSHTYYDSITAFSKTSNFSKIPYSIII